DTEWHLGPLRPPGAIAGHATADRRARYGVLWPDALDGPWPHPHVVASDSTDPACGRAGVGACPRITVSDRRRWRPHGRRRDARHWPARRNPPPQVRGRRAGGRGVHAAGRGAVPADPLLAPCRPATAG